MEDVFNTTDCISRTKDRNKIYSESNFKLVPQVTKKWVQEVSMGKYPGLSPMHKTYNGPSCRSHYSSSFRDKGSSNSSSQPCRKHSIYQPKQGPRKMKCYYCEGEHHIKRLQNHTRDKAKDKLKMVDLTKK